MKLKLFFEPLISMILPSSSKERIAGCDMENGKLLIDCNGCTHSPDIGTKECIRCISRLIGKNGEPERMILRSGKDTEYFGDAVSLINGISRIDRLGEAISDEKHHSKCSLCSRSPSKLIKNAWTDFPEPDLDKIRSILNEYDPTDDKCGECVLRTYRSVEQIEHALTELSKDAAMAAFNLTEV